VFLDLTLRRNPTLVEQAIALHQTGRIPANCYVIDLDAVDRNAGVIAREAARHGLKTFAMTKQMGRNGSFCRAVARGGIPAAVSVDMECARACRRAGMTIGHLGHLVQIPRNEADAAASMTPDYWTVFATEKAQEASDASLKRQRVQPTLARIVAPGDTFYRGHEGGFAAADVVAVADAIDAMPGLSFAGFTSFPTQLYDLKSRKVKPTPNLRTLEKAAEALQAAGRKGIEINAPGTTSAEILSMLAAAGATQIEPGHGLTGTTPLHAVEDLPETPAVVYLSEVSHRIGAEAFCFGGGLYIDPVFPDYALTAIVSREPTSSQKALKPVEIPSAASIDYYGMIDNRAEPKARVGDSVVFGFRAQAFVTRAYTVGVAGLSRGSPVVEAVHDAFGRVAEWPL
jgi:predicted amino acid racemase